LDETPFRFRALAALAGRGQIGGDREVALAAFTTARLVSAVVPPNALSAPVRAARANAARQWLSTLALPAALRAPFSRLAEATSGADRAVQRTALRAVIDAAAPVLDGHSRAELEKLYEELHELAVNEMADLGAVNRRGVRDPGQQG
jgi:hypothetical protein